MGRRALRKIDPALDLSRHLVFPAPSQPAAGPERAAGDVARPPAPFNAEKLFGRAAPLEVEIGSGKGLFLTRAATLRAEHDFLGIELAAKYARFAAARVARAGLSNVRVLCGDAVAFFRGLPDAAALAAVHVYFPDPWWKKRHHKRRVMNAALLRDIERTLRAGGSLHFWTDVEEYFRASLELIAAETRLEGPLPVAASPAAGDLDYHTHFERRTRLAEQPVFRAEFRRVD